ncbi:MAG: LysR family transcriptional regulator [Casimicrobiaceae bacterium]|nr:LysR family transcriptional regulator [Casimicrobiaceae bacterium]
MTLVQLRHFVILADTGSFARAAEALFLTQPALTRSIQALEHELGGALFDRLGRQIELTAFGRELLPRARRLVADAAALREFGKALHAGVVGTLRVGLSSGPGALLSEPLLRHVAQCCPQLRVHIARGSTDLLIGMLREQRLDTAVVDVRSVRPAADLVVGEVVEFSTGFLVRPGHPLLAPGQRVTIDEILAYPIASTPLSDEVARALIRAYGPAANPDDMVRLRSDETLSLVMSARHTDAVVLTIRACAPDLIPLPIDPPLGVTARLGMVTLARREEAPTTHIVREQWRALVAKVR